MLSKLFVTLLLGATLSATAAECLQDATRTAELRALDDAQISALQSRFGAVAVPASARELLDRLVQASSVLRGRRIEMLGYQHALVNAHAADHGKLLVSSAVWAQAPDALTPGEVAAVLAHELAHIELEDSLHAACSALGRVGSPAVSLADAIQTVGQEAFDSTTELSVLVRQEAHVRELGADARGMQLMHAAGLDAQDMVRLVRRISRPANDTMGSGTHPQAHQRIRSVEIAYAALTVN